jgi:hypothetical protein
MRLVVATALGLATAATLFFLIGVLPALLHSPAEPSDGPGGGLIIGFYLVSGLAYGVFVAVFVSLFAFIYLSPAWDESNKAR